MKKIISPYCQHRQNIGTHSNWQNKSCLSQEQQNNLIKKLASRPGLHSDNVQRQELAQCIIQFIALLSSLRNCDSPFQCIQEPDVKLKNALPNQVKVNNTPQKIENNYVLTLLKQPIIHLFERTEQIVSQYDPLRFPMAEAIPAPYTKKAKTLSVNFFDQDTNIPIPVSDFNKTEFICGKKFIKFKKIKKFIPEGKFYHQNIEGPESAINYMKVRYKGKNYIIKENKPDEYYLFDPNSITPRSHEVPVYFKKNSKIYLDVLSYNLFYQDSSIAIPISDFNKDEFICSGFINFKKINNFYPDGKFYDPNLGGPESAINYMKVRYKGKNYIIKENKPGEYYLFDPIVDPNSIISRSHEVPVYFKKNGKVCLSVSSYNFFYQDRNIAIPISDFNKDEFIYGKFINFKKINNFYPDGQFYDPNIGGPESAINYMKVSYKGENYIIKENNLCEYYLFNPNLPRTLENEIPVYFKTKDGKVHLGTDMPPNKKLCYGIRKGHCYIKMFGSLYLSNYNWETNRQEVILADGYFKSLTDPITQSKINIWQPLTPLFIELYKNQKSRRPMEKHYGTPTFTNEEENIINRISVNINKNYVYIAEPNEAPNRYGGAKIYFAKKTNDPFSSIFGQYIKMNKKWIPVYTLIDVRDGIYYEIHDDEKVYELQYVDSYTTDDGNNWVFKRT